MHQYRIGLSSVDGRDEPLDKVTDQSFVAYHKGALGMVAYQTELDPARTARVLGDYFQSHAGLAAPYPLASNFDIENIASTAAYKAAEPQTLAELCDTLLPHLKLRQALSA